MPCYTPRRAFRTRERFGKYGITFSESHPDILFEVKVPCGLCVGCRLDYARNWAVRCMHESQLHRHNCFLTLTYDEDHLPVSGSLNKIDYQLFMKRLRKFVSSRSFRTEYPGFFNGHIGYLLSGEYGEKFSRPHYHACLFNFDFPDKVLWKRSADCNWYTSNILASLWPFGYSSLGSVTFESASYVARYMVKKVNGVDSSEFYGDKLKEFSASSRRPAVGLNWIKKFYTDVYPSNEVIVNGVRSSPPRYYDKVLERDFPDLYGVVKSNREYDAFLGSVDFDNSPERLNVRHELAVLRLREFSGSFELEGKNFQSGNIDLYDKRVIDYKNRT